MKACKTQVTSHTVVCTGISLGLQPRGITMQRYDLYLSRSWFLTIFIHISSTTMMCNSPATVSPLTTTFQAPDNQHNFDVATLSGLNPVIFNYLGTATVSRNLTSANSLKSYSPKVKIGPESLIFLAFISDQRLSVHHLHSIK